MAAKLVWVNLVFVGLAIVAIGMQQIRLDRLERRLAEVSAAPAAGPRPSRAPRSAPAVQPMAVASRAFDGRPEAGDIAVVDDHLWSESGREAIRDVVEERDEQERDQMRERWQQMREYRINQLVDELAEELELNESDADAMHTILTDYMEIRSSRWQRMREADFDPATFEAEMQRARTTMQDQVRELVGDDGLTALEERMRGRRRPL